MVISHSESLFIVEGRIAREVIMGDGLAGDGLFPGRRGGCICMSGVEVTLESPTLRASVL